MPSFTRFLLLDEALRIIADLKRRGKRSPSSRLNLIVIRLAMGCGLRRCEIAALNMSDVTLVGPRPCLRIRKETTKGQKGKKRSRLVPLFWDRGTFEDIKRWVEFRKSRGVGPDDPLLCGVCSVNSGKRLTGLLLASRFKTAIRVLGPDRVAQLSIHAARHSFCSLSRAAGRSSIEIRDAVGHTDERTTNIYLHAVEQENVPDVFCARDS